MLFNQLQLFRTGGFPQTPASPGEYADLMALSHDCTFSRGSSFHRSIGTVRKMLRDCGALRGMGELATAFTTFASMHNTEVDFQKCSLALNTPLLASSLPRSKVT